PYGLGGEPGPSFYGAPSLAGIPATTDIQSAPPAPPAIYIINGAAPYRHGRVRKGYAPYPGPRVLSMARRPRWDAPDPGEIGYPALAQGPRIIHVTVPRGL